MIRLALLVFLFGYNLILATGQELSDTTLLESVEVVASPLRTSPIGTRSEEWNISKSQNNSTNIAELLKGESSAFIKTYGSGSLATSSIRGGSAGHTAILWNGFSIQSPMLGLHDLGLFPSGFYDKVSLQYGGGSATWGNGAIGAVLSLSNKASFIDQLVLSTQSTLGSFGNFHQQVQFNIGNSKIQSGTRLFYQEGQNDFSYRINEDLPEKKQTNSALLNKGILQELYYQPNDKNTFAAYFWKQHANRQIPPLTTQTKNIAYQKDDFTRLALHWKRRTNKLLLQSRAGFFDDYIDYVDDQILLRSLTHFQSIIGEVEAQWSLDNHQFNLGVNNTFTKAFADAYASPPTENRIAAFGSYRFDWLSWKTQLSIRQEWIGSKASPLVPSLGIEKKLTNFLILQAKVSRNFRLPTFNDRYWQPGGNINLQAESGWSQEMGFTLKHKKEKFKASYSTTAFNRSINNWILWSKQEGQSFWSANNIAKVWSRGIEQRINMSTKWKRWEFNFSSGYDFILSSNQISITTPRIEAGEQLNYVPIHQAFINGTLGWKKWYASYQHSFTGQVETSNEPLDAYHVASFRIQKQWTSKHFQPSFFVAINNLWNANYRVIDRRPMPDRNFQIGINFLIHK